MKKGEATRLNILQKAFELIYKNGYQSTSIDEIIKQTSVTKGSYFHHFKNKDEMGLALINEILYPGMLEHLVKPLLTSDHPKKDIYATFNGLLTDTTFFNVNYGCPMVNLIEEMTPLNEQFNDALSAFTDAWKNAITKCLKNGIKAQRLSKDVHPEQVAIFLIATYGGIRGLGKIYGDGCYKSFLRELKRYLDNLK